jgi:hypothetical protein
MTSAFVFSTPRRSHKTIPTAKLSRLLLTAHIDFPRHRPFPCPRSKINFQSDGIVPKHQVSTFQILFGGTHMTETL